jgi:hypothetical protein
MSATIYFRYLENQRNIPAPAPSAFIEAMTQVFGASPWNLGDGDIRTLHGMAAVHKATPNPYIAMIDAISEGQEAIQVWPVY